MSGSSLSTPADSPGHRSPAVSGAGPAPLTAPYGSWPSPLSADALAAGAVGMAGVATDGDTVWWAEVRPTEQGRSVLVRRSGGSTVDALPAPWSARSRVHEYGGGAWWLGAGTAFFVNDDDQRIYRLDGDEPVAVTPEPPHPRAWRYADGRLHPTVPWLVAVRDRHPSPDAPAAEVVNELVAVGLDEAGAEPRVIGVELGDDAQSDFVSTPRFSADGRWLSWIRWNHPDMPWDRTELCVAPVFGGLRLGNTQVVAGGAESVTGADWTADGRLVFSADRTGFWNLYAWRPGHGADEALTDLVGSEIGSPAWVFGTQSWVELDDGRLAVVVTTDATDAVGVIGDGGDLVVFATPIVAVADLAAGPDGTVLVHAGTATALPQIVALDLDNGAVAAQVRPPDDLGLDPGWISRARPMSYEENGRAVHAFYYPPTGAGFGGPAGERPPLVVMGHGGPTSHTSPSLNLRIQYWTSRGFAVADVNYGGSTGFGRAYRERLKGQWGVVDVEDCITVASRLAADGAVDGSRMAIRGGSAGGFTVLTALTRSDVFAAGTSLYGVADLEALAADTHKFEARYLDGLIGPYPEARGVYVERSPLSHVGALACPLLVLQGLDDPVVPPNQAEAIVAPLAAKGIPHAYVAFAGEQHGFRQAANIVRSLEVELWFYGRVFGFEPADPIDAPEGAVGL
ncbi:MAG: prolyl oligopeptidase family serine peptidase [Acidimicrobiales bacterium]